MATNTDADTDWFFDWPSGYVRYRNGKREVWQDSFSKPSQPTLTEAEREAVERAISSLVGVEDLSADASQQDDAAACVLRSLLERHSNT